jgi:hypothetical protein
VVKEGLMPPVPEKIFWREGREEEEEEEGKSSVAPGNLKGLRQSGGDHYKRFCEHFLQCAVPARDWNRESRKRKISSIVTVSLEAFAVTCYANGYDVWNRRYKNEGSEMGDDMSAISVSTKNSSDSFRFTNDSKGSRKYGGWSNEGMLLYNDLVIVLGRQRSRLGCTFEKELLVQLSIKQKARRGGSGNSEMPRASNELEKLMGLVGV